MHIEKDRVVTLNYTLKDDRGNVIDESQGSDFVYLHGASNIIPGLEDALTGRSQGDSFTVSVPPDRAYGVRDESRTQEVPREMFPDDTEVQVGMQFNAQGPEGGALLVTVVDVAEQTVTVDGNHPLAGETLHFDLEVMNVRDATAEELAHGHAHGPGGNHGH